MEVFNIIQSNCSWGGAAFDNEIQWVGFWDIWQSQRSSSVGLQDAFVEAPQQTQLNFQDDFQPDPFLLHTASHARVYCNANAQDSVSLFAGLEWIPDCG